jgi:hypothetical protein
MKVPPLVRARRFVRKMWGSSRAHLIEADNNACYVVKFANNPQGGRRILINETIASLLLDEVKIATPEAAYVAIDDKFLQSNPEVFMMSGKERIAVQPGLHFGSRLPGIPGQHSICDFLPDAMIPELYNRRDFPGALAMDKWLSNGDARQAIFYRDWVAERAGVRWVVQMIDHGGIFQGRDWTFRNSPVQGVYAKRAVYGTDVSIRDFEPWLDAISDFGLSDLEEAFSRLPSEWIGTDEPELRRVMSTLYARRGQTRGLLAESIDCFWGRNRHHSSLVLQFCAFR